MWRDHLLALACQQHPDWSDEVRYVLVAPVQAALLPRCYHGEPIYSAVVYIRLSKPVTTLPFLVEL